MNSSLKRSMRPGFLPRKSNQSSFFILKISISVEAVISVVQADSPAKLGKSPTMKPGLIFLERLL